MILDIGGNRRLLDLRRALTARGTLVVVGGTTDGRWIGGSDRLIRARLLSPVVRQELRTFITSENAEDLMVLGEMIESGKSRPPSTGRIRSARPQRRSATCSTGTHEAR